MCDEKVFLKHQVNWNTVFGATRDLPLCNSWFADIPIEVMNEHQSVLVGRYVPTKIIRVCITMISLVLIIIAFMLLVSC